MTHSVSSNAPRKVGQRLAAAAERLLNTLEFDALCGSSASDDDVLVTVMPSFTRSEPGRFNAVVTCTARRGSAVNWSAMRVCPLPKDSPMLHAIGPALNRFGQITLRGLEERAYALRAYRSADTFEVQPGTERRYAVGGLGGPLGGPAVDKGVKETWSELPPMRLSDERLTVLRSVFEDRAKIAFYTESTELSGASVEFCVTEKATGDVLQAPRMKPFRKANGSGYRTDPVQYAFPPGHELEIMYRLVPPESQPAE